MHRICLSASQHQHCCKHTNVHCSCTCYRPCCSALGTPAACAAHAQHARLIGRCLRSKPLQGTSLPFTCLCASPGISSMCTRVRPHAHSQPHAHTRQANSGVTQVAAVGRHMACVPPQGHAGGRGRLDGAPAAGAPGAERGNVCRGHRPAAEQLRDGLPHRGRRGRAAGPPRARRRGRRRRHRLGLASRGCACSRPLSSTLVGSTPMRRCSPPLLITTAAAVTAAAAHELQGARACRH